MNKQYTLICRNKATRKVSPQVCDGESEFKVVYNFRHEHPEYDPIEVHEAHDPYLFPTFRDVVLFIVALCAISLVLFPFIIAVIHLIHWLYEKV